MLTASLARRTGDIELLITDGATTMANMRDASLAMKDLAGTLTTAAERLVASADSALVSVAGTSDAMRSVVDTSGPDINALVTELRGSANAFTRMSTELESMVAENRAPLRDFTGEGLYEMTNFLTEARSLIDGLSRMTTEVQRDPARFLFGNQQQGYEAGNSGGR